MKLPVLFLNFKTYSEATGRNAIALAKAAERISKRSGKNIALVVQAVDIRAVSAAVSLPVFAQHIDPIAAGAHTGSILAEAVREAGAVGAVVNHAENKRDNEFVRASIASAKEAKLEIMVCAETTERAKQIAAFAPDFIAIEPPELIGGDISVSSAKPELITSSVRAVAAVDPKIKMITGAGIKNSTDVRRAIELGTKGVFVASGVVKAKSPEAALEELVSGL